jgi:hypothetical protein
MAGALLEPGESLTEYLSDLRLTKRYRPLVQPGPSASSDEARSLYPWDVITARRDPLRVVLGDRVLDLTEFQAAHYGGTPIMRMLAGTDLSAEFSRAHPNNQVRMPEVYDIAPFEIPAGLENLTRIAFNIARAANVVDLLDPFTDIYHDSARLRSQRACKVLQALDTEILWSNAMARACGSRIAPSVQKALRQQHVRAVEGMELRLGTGASRAPDPTDPIIAQYQSIYQSVLENLAEGMRKSVSIWSDEADVSVLRQCFDQHVELLRRGFMVASEVARVQSEPPPALEEAAPAE